MYRQPATSSGAHQGTDIEETRVTAKPHSVLPSPLQTAKLLAAEFALGAVERDERGGTPKAERDALRLSAPADRTIDLHPYVSRNCRRRL